MKSGGWRYLDVSRLDGIAVVRLHDPNDDRLVPEAHPMHRELRDVFPVLADDDGIAAVVLAGGSESFCPFPSLENLDRLLSSRPSGAAALQREARQIVDNVIDFDKPLVAAVSADARGMGAQLALLADFMVADESVVLQDTHVRLGLGSGDGATVIWPLVLGLARARSHVLRGLPVSAATLHELGVVAELGTGAEDVVARATALAAKLASKPEAYRATKQALNQWLRMASNLTLPMASSLQVDTYDSPGFLELRRRARDGEVQ